VFEDGEEKVFRVELSMSKQTFASSDLFGGALKNITNDLRITCKLNTAVVA
jgi:hypothetical protein